jgi:hypothetical protein
MLNIFADVDLDLGQINPRTASARASIMMNASHVIEPLVDFTISCVNEECERYPVSTLERAEAHDLLLSRSAKVMSHSFDSAKMAG